MANDLNQCNFIGRLGKDPVLRHAPSGSAVASFSIAVGSQWKDKNTGQPMEETEWVNCVAWNRTGEIAAEYLKKGSQVAITGRMKTRTWEKEGQKHYTTEIVVDRLQMLGPKPDGEGNKRNQPNAEQETQGFDDDIPF